MQLSLSRIVTSIVLCGILAAAFPHTTNAASERIDYSALFKAIAQVESDQGATSRNVYQLTYAFIYDLERITGEHWSYAKTTGSKSRSEQAMRTYWAYYYSRIANKTGVQPSAELLAKLHHVGYRGLKSKRTAAAIYWRKVSKWYRIFKNK